MAIYKVIHKKTIRINGKEMHPDYEDEFEETREIKNLVKNKYIEKVKNKK